MTIGILYASHSTNKGTATFNSIPFNSASIQWKRDDASTMSFKSIVKLEEADRIRYKSNTADFGGQIYKIRKGVNGEYDYDVISYTRLYHDKVTCSYKNLTSSKILKKVLKLSKNDFRTSGIQDTEIIHSSLKWENTTIYDIALQLAWLEQQAGYRIVTYVDADGTLIFRYADEQQKGYSFTSVFDYEETYDSTDIITASKITFDGKTIANAESSTDLIAKWGYVTEVDECQAETGASGTNTTTAQSTGLKDNSQISKYNIPNSVVKQALSIAKEGNSGYDNLKLLYKWVNSHIKYHYYYNTKNGAAGTLSRRWGNCCDNAHLLIAMARAVGIKARYCHAKSGGKGHVWGEYYVNNKWLAVDTGTPNTSKYWGGHSNYAGSADSRSDTINF